MSAAEIIKELPKLSERERREVRAKRLELATENADIQLCNESALAGALLLDRMENADTHG